jgi:hypothetical protein
VSKERSRGGEVRGREGEVRGRRTLGIGALAEDLLDVDLDCAFI